MENNDNPKIYVAIASILQEMQAVSKAKKNSQQGYAYRGIDDFYNTLHPLFAKHGVFIVHDVLDSNTIVETQKDKNIYRTCLKINYTFYATDGSSVSCTTYAESIDYGDKGTGKCLSYALKYVLMQMFLIPTEDLQDNDADELTPQKTDSFLKRIEACKTVDELTALYNSNKTLAGKFLDEFKAKKEKLLQKTTEN